MDKRSALLITCQSYLARHVRCVSKSERNCGGAAWALATSVQPERCDGRLGQARGQVTLAQSAGAMRRHSLGPGYMDRGGARRGICRGWFRLIYGKFGNASNNWQGLWGCPFLPSVGGCFTYARTHTTPALPATSFHKSESSLSYTPAENVAAQRRLASILNDTLRPSPLFKRGDTFLLEEVSRF